MRHVLVLTGLAVLAVAPSGFAADTPAGGWVVLPIAEYRELRARATPPSPPPVAPPVAATVSRVDYDLRVQGDAAVGETRLAVDVLQEGWACLPVPPGLRVDDARLDGKTASLLPAGAAPVKGQAAGEPCLLLSHPGRALLTLRTVLPVTAGPTSQVLLPPATAPVTRAVLELGTAGLDMSVSGGLLTGAAPATAPTRFTAHARTGERLAFSWHRAQADHRGERPLRLRAHVVQTVGLSEDAAQLSAEVQLEVVQGLLETVTLQLPPGLSVTRVATTGDWDAGGDTVTVRLLDPVADGLHLSLTGEMRVPREGRIEVPLLSVAGAERETGGVAVDVLGAGEITDAHPRGLQPADPEDLGGDVARRASPSLAAFRDVPVPHGTTRALAVDVRRYTAKAVPVAAIDESHVEALLSEEGPVLVRARWAVRNQQRSFLGVTLPPGATLWSAAVGGRPRRPGRGAGDLLLLPLLKARAGGEPAPFAVEVVYVVRAGAWDRQGRATVQLPAVDLDVPRAGLLLRTSPRYAVEPQPGAFHVDAQGGPVSPVLAVDEPALATASDTEEQSKDKGQVAQQALADQYRQERATGRLHGIEPVRVSMPEFGMPQWLSSELTAAGSAPVIEVAYRRTGKEE